MNHCVRHYEEPVVDHCRTCHRPYCSRCLVYSFGPKKPPFCVGCALSASGVRNTTADRRGPAHAAPGRTAAWSGPRSGPRRRQAKAEARAIKRAGKHGERRAGRRRPAPRHHATCPVPTGPDDAGEPLRPAARARRQLTAARSGDRGAASRSATSLASRSASLIASICTTSRAALIEPSTATVATGMPLGIWTVA